MLTILGHPRRLCDRLPRRAFLRVGSLAGLGLGWPTLLRAAGGMRAADRSFGRARRCILLMPFGGPSQIDTFDPKPNAPSDVRGEFKPIATAVPGLYFSEMFPRLAHRAGRLRVVRSVSHADSVHTTAGYTMLTGMPHPKAIDPVGAVLARPSPDDHPHVGSILAHARPARAGLPPFVALPEVVRDAAVNTVPGQGAGFLGGRCDPFLFEADAKRVALPPPDALSAKLPPLRFEGRRSLRERLDRGLAAVEADGRFAALDAHYRRAFDLIRSTEARRAFDLAVEPAAGREAYGPHLFGQGCLLARRLIEAGVALVTVYWHYEGPDDSPCWDTHENNFRHLRDRLAPPADRAVAALLDDLETRGLLDETLVVWMGEFGRSPRVNRKAGREHWPHVQSVLLAGGGIGGGGTYGASDRIGGHPADSPVSPADLTATILHALGVTPDLELRDRTGRPFPASPGTPVYALFG